MSAPPSDIGFSDARPPRPHAKALPTFAIVAALLIVLGLAGFDRWFYERVSCVWNTESDPTDRDLYTVTRPFWIAVRYSFGLLYGPLLAAAVLLILAPLRWRTVARALIVLGLTALAANVLQAAIGRLRPNQAASHLAFVPPLSALLTKQRVSFPSGEAATAFAFATLAGAMFPRGRPHFYAVGALAAGARLVNGAHYMSDVAAGALLGVLVSRGLWSWSVRRFP